MTSRARFAGLAATFAALALVPEPVAAQVAPRIMIAFDTSGSMGVDLNGVPTYGDGVLSGCSRMSAGHYCGANCTAGIDTDCDGLPNDSRMFVATEAVSNMVLSTGDDVAWALARFDQDQDPNIFCTVTRSGQSYSVHAIDTVECEGAAMSYGNPQCNTGSAISSCGGGFVNVNDFPTACRPGVGGRPSIRRINYVEAYSNTDGDPRTNPRICLNYYPGSCDGTAASGEVLVGFPELDAFAGRSNIPAILAWMDHQETNFIDSTVVGNYCDHASGGDCELRPIGRTPLAGILRASEAYMTNVRASDDRRACRPYSVILLTDGIETCGGSPSAAADSLWTTNGIRTYVVGLSIASSSERAALNSIAASGRTGTAFFADDPVTLSAALAQIVQDSLLFEVCNGLDDDCDGLVDEGVQNACGSCGPVPAETCNGSDDDCDGRTDEGVANRCGTCGPEPAEICNRIDDDCDGAIDEGVCGGCSPSPEVCDNRDNDCDGEVDESLTQRCGVDIGLCTIGEQVCIAGSWGPCSGVGPSPEECDGKDNDCDGVVDGMVQSCGSSTGACSPGTQLCTNGTWGSCEGGTGPAPAEICNGLDDDCDGDVDEMATGTGGACGSDLGVCTPGTVECQMGMLTCVGGVSPGVEVCNGLDDDCDGSIDESVPTMGACGSDVGACRPGVRACVGGDYECVGGSGPTDEICNNRDDDCDGNVDEGNPGGGAECGSTVGACSPGAIACVGGNLVCTGGTAPGIESCNGLDDDCDGHVDEGNPGGGAACGGTDVGVCERAVLACIDGDLACIGGIGPSDERCDGLDNDCDGSVDEGDPEGGAACGDDTGECSFGATRCVGGELTCEGGTGPTEEICNGLDDDCDTLIDEGTGLGEACGTDVGECVPGFNVCEDGMVVCRGATDRRDEVCNGLDDDCDGAVDEGLALGGPCGSDVGLCMPGALQCISGVEVCVDEVRPTLEGCDCEDNDCDGTTDEAPPGGSLCPPGSACVECQCALPCVASEFGHTCPTGRTAVTRGEECFCVAPRCEAEACAGETVTRDGEVLCAPDAAGIQPCVCRNNECTFACDGVVCGDGTVCDPRDGRCVEDSCRGLGCPDGELCDPLTGACAPDLCATVSCGAGEACRAGTCERSCGTVSCGAGERCTRGACVADPCAESSCDAGRICDPSDGSCVPDACEGVACPGSTICDSLTGDCEPDACLTLRCPAGERCEGGECVRDGARPDAGVDAGLDAGVDAGGGDPETRVLAAGGGGCFCAVGAGADRRGPSGGATALLLALGLGLVVRRTRGRARLPFVRLLRARTAARLGLAAIVAFAAAGCDVDPYCLTCTDEDAGPQPDAGPDAGVDAGRRDAGPRDAGPVDAGVDAGCTPGAPELCNERDDDCDGRIDEGIDTQTDAMNCGACGSVCAPPGAFGECVAGECTIASCDVGRFDRDEDPENGCEARCLATATDDTLCDLRDNDCDFLVDEDVDLQTDPSNCGRCGRTCRFVRAGASCVDGVCTMGTCEPGFVDLDENPANGCEYSCAPASSGVETCNAIDDDCDGRIDEGNPDGGAACGSDVGLCSPGVEQCVAGRLVCVGGVTPVVEICDGLDNDCDGSVDENDPGGGRLCGSSVGVCTAGREQCVDGALVCVGATTGGVELCNGRDDDCDGTIDEGNPEGGTSCGSAEGTCSPGTLRCTGGTLVCDGAVGPVAEICDGLDNDCDGDTDEGNPGGGSACGTDVGMCRPGTLTCAAGSLTCVGAVGPSPAELCNGLDDDCDGQLDEGNPGGGGACGSAVGSCRQGAFTCTGGTLSCVGATLPALDVCNGLDDDCDGAVDENFDLSTDVRHCGRCDRACSFPNAIPRCVPTSGGPEPGVCEILACQTGFVDANGDPSDGCELECTPSGAEVCNGADDDCDGTIDEGVVAPANFCNPNGVCGTTSATCGGAAGWECNYPAATYEETEVSCDGLDNDCDGAIDEAFPTVGTICTNGIGECRRTGTVQCNAAGTGTVCTAPPAGAAGVEQCNDRDDDCDGTVDEEIDLSTIPTVDVPRSSGSGTVRVMMYEASRADASASSQGQASRVACSRPGVLPWTSVTWGQANAACCALNPSGTCEPGGTGWRLCDAEDWENACEGPAGACRWSYAGNTTACTTSSPLTCNGEEYDASPAPGDQDALLPTGTAFPMCHTTWGSSGIYDLSGNAKEWTYTSVSTDVYQIRGGAYTNVEGGRTCQFDFTVGSSTFSFPNTGFRCCMY